jgi:hypothetical protein
MAADHLLVFTLHSAIRQTGVAAHIKGLGAFSVIVSIFREFQTCVLSIDAHLPDPGKPKVSAWQRPILIPMCPKWD